MTESNLRNQSCSRGYYHKFAELTISPSGVKYPTYHERILSIFSYSVLDEVCDWCDYNFYTNCLHKHPQKSVIEICRSAKE